MAASFAGCISIFGKPKSHLTCENAAQMPLRADMHAMAENSVWPGPFSLAAKGRNCVQMCTCCVQMCTMLNIPRSDGMMKAIECRCARIGCQCAPRIRICPGQRWGWRYLRADSHANAHLPQRLAVPCPHCVAAVAWLSRRPASGSLRYNRLRGRFAPGRRNRKEPLMDASTVDATCNILLVVIGFVGLLLMVMRE